ncbi:hypothetical protein Ndes2526B_g04256 [Nannochloris sp. 'desiccata']
MPPCLDNLSDNVLHCVLFHLADDIADLLHLSRANKRYNAAVLGADNAWKRAYELSYGSLGQLPTPVVATVTASSHHPAVPLEPQTWLGKYKDRLIEHGFKRRQLAAARLLKAQSTVQTLEQQVYRLAQTLRQEKQELKRLTDLLATLRAAIQSEEVHEAHTYWVPTAVTRAQGSLVVQAPQNALERKRELESKVAVGELECTKLEKMITARRAELQKAKVRLQVLQP